MDLPRFSSGQIGNLTYAHLNEAFQLLDKLRPMLTGESEFTGQGDPFVIARITGASTTQPNLMTWEEVRIKPATSVAAAIAWETRPGGKKSGAATDQLFEPAFQPPVFESTTSEPLTAGTVALIRKTKRADGKPAWLVVSSVGGGGPDVFPAEITGSQAREAVGGQTYRWSYAWREVYLSDAPTTGFYLEWLPLPNGRVGCHSPGCSPPAFNGAERYSTAGLGGSGPPGAVERNAPIGNGTVVMMTYTNTVLPYFSLGPATSISCNEPPLPP